MGPSEAQLLNITTFNMELLKFIGKDPFQWDITFNVLGWFASNVQGNAMMAISEAKARVLVRWIEQARTWHNPTNKLP